MAGLCGCRDSFFVYLAGYRSKNPFYQSVRILSNTQVLLERIRVLEWVLKLAVFNIALSFPIVVIVCNRY